MSKPDKCPLCGADLYLMASFALPLEYVAHEPLDIKIVPNSAVSSGWAVECTNDHVIDLSGESGADYAEPFTWFTREASNGNS